MTEVEHGSMKDLKVGKYVMIDGVPCRVVEIEVSAPGKHGAAKMRVTAIGIFDGTKRTLLKPSDADIQIPIIERKRGQIITIMGDVAQVMDLSSFETFEMTIPEDLRANAEAGKEVEYMETMGKRMITRIA
jgi:translation initiation factor 5A